VTDTNRQSSRTVLPANIEGVIWVVVSTAIWALIFASGKLSGGAVPALQVMFLRYVGGFATCLFLVMARRERWLALRSPRPHLHVLRAVCGCGGGIATIYAAAHMPIADATAIGLLKGILAVVLAIVILKEQVSGRRWLAVFVCASGAAIVVFGQGAFRVADASYGFPAAMALLGALFIACEALLIKVFATAERALGILLHVNAFGTLILLGPALWLWPSGNGLTAAPFLLLGPAAIFAQYCNIRGYRIADVSVVAPLGYTWIIFAALIGLVIFAEVPTVTTVAGSAVIVAGGILLARRNT
jgi:drug/metabolite transporter (DMT)-like permease